jgi:hypothetical protein
MMEVFAITAPEQGPICDFCSSTEIVAQHICNPFVSHKDGPIVLQDKDGIWCACAECDLLIRNGQRSLLLERSWRTFKEMYGFTHPALKEELRNLHEQFWLTRKEAS